MRSSAAADQELIAPAQIATRYERRGRINTARHGGLHAAPGNPFQDVCRDLVGARVIIREFCWTAEGSFCAEGTRNGGYFLVIGCHDDVGKQTAIAGGGDRIRDDRFARERPDVLARNAFASASRRDDRNNHSCLILVDFVAWPVYQPLTMPPPEPQ